MIGNKTTKRLVMVLMPLLGVILWGAISLLSCSAQEEAAPGASRIATIVVSVPPAAKLTFNGWPTTSVGKERKFVSPPCSGSA
jgi:hypothetical protein